ncbi:MAG: hypothetical protein IJZ79_06970 [Bacilli bacterium]|nr:hypothetical protein [Bacilli bacterium]
MDKVLVSFYYHIIEEASRGKIFTNEGVCNICFNTKVPTENIDLHYTDKVVPTLIINDKEEFDKALIEYMDIATSFYEDRHYHRDLILAMLFADATYEDFNNPVDYINRKKNFMLDEKMKKFESGFSLGYSEFFDGELFVKVDRDTIFYETPYVLNIMIRNENDFYSFPSINFGISGDTGYIYTIQNRKVIENKSSFQKKVNRLFYKIGEGFDPKVDNFDTYDEGNLKDVSGSFLVAADIIFSLFERVGIRKIILPTLRIIRWNNKEEAYKRMLDKDYNPDKSRKYEDEHYMIQKNITEKFIRTFMRLAYHFEGLDVVSYPFEGDSNMIIVNNGITSCNNSLLSHVYGLVKKKEDNLKFHR